jgi:hypothetical protein
LSTTSALSDYTWVLPLQWNKVSSPDLWPRADAAACSMRLPRLPRTTDSQILSPLPQLPAPNLLPSSAGRRLPAGTLLCLKRLFSVSRFAVPVRLYQQNTYLCAQCNVGHPALVSRARSRVYQGSLHITLSRGAILAVHLMTCSSSWPIANVSI